MRTIVAALVLLTTMAFAWGPATHYYLNQKGLTSVTWETMSGTEMPNAFQFGRFVSGSNCSKFSELSNLMYAGYLVKQAIAESNNSAHLNLALGFGASVTGDFAGNYDPDAYLGGHDASPKMTNWIAVWPLMTAVDAFVAQNIHSPQNETSYVPTLSKDDSEFMKRARDSYAKAAAAAGVSIVQITADEIGYCANRWREVIQRETARSMAMPRSSYEWEMIYASSYNATTAAETQQHFFRAASCAIPAISMWESLILNTTYFNPESALVETELFYVNWFDAGRCTPPGARLATKAQIASAAGTYFSKGW